MAEGGEVGSWEGPSWEEGEGEDLTGGRGGKVEGMGGALKGKEKVMEGGKPRQRLIMGGEGHGEGSGHPRTAPRASQGRVAQP